MTPHDLIAAFETVAEAPDGVARLRELVLQLAVRGQLVPQDSSEEAAETALGRVAAEKDRLVREKQIPRPKRLPPLSPDDVPFGVPQGWEWVRLGELALLINGDRGKNYPSRAHYVPKGVPFINAGHLSDGRVDTREMNFISEQRFELLRSGKVLDGDVLYCLRGSLGKTGIVQGLGRGAIASSLLIVRMLDASLPNYIYLVLSSPLGRTLVRQYDNGSAQPNLSGANVAKYTVPFPPPAEQKRIVARVDELMGLLDRLEAARDSREATRVALRDAALAALRDADSAEEVDVAWQRIAERMDDLFTDPADVEPLRQTVLQLAVRGRLVPQDEGDEPASRLLERILAEKAPTHGKRRGSRGVAELVAPELGIEVPAGWTCTQLRDLIDGTGAGWSPKCHAHPTDSESDWGVLKTTAVQPNCYLPQHHKALPSKLKPRPNLEVHPGDLLVTRAGPWFRVGVAAFVAQTRPRLMLSDKIIRCSLPPLSARGEWLAMNINSGPGADFLRGKQTGMDAAQMNISQSRLAQTPVLLPPLAEQHRIVAKVDELMGLLDRLAAKLASAKASHGAFAAAAVHHPDG